jgi:hypothetical protein
MALVLQKVFSTVRYRVARLRYSPGVTPVIRLNVRWNGGIDRLGAPLRSSLQLGQQLPGESCMCTLIAQAHLALRWQLVR